MIIFLYGPDTYRSRQKLTQIIETYQKKHPYSFNLKVFDLEQSQFKEIQDHVFSPCLFQEKKLTILKNAFANEKFKEEFLKNKKSFLESKNLILFYEETAPKDKFFKFLEKQAETQKFDLLKRKGLEKWIKQEFEKYQVKINSQVIPQLIEFIGNDLWQQSNEIKKLASYNKEVTPKNVELLIKPKIKTDIFKSIDALASKDKKQTLIFFNKHLSRGDSPGYLLSMINYQFRNLLLVKDLMQKNLSSSEIMKKSRLHPFVFRKTYQQAQLFTLEEIKKIYHKIFEVDLGIKSGKIEAETGLLLLLA